MAIILAQSASLFNLAALARNPLELTVKVLETNIRAAFSLLFCNNWVIIEHRFFWKGVCRMNKKPFEQGRVNDINGTIKKLSHKKDAPKFVFAIILVLYVAASVALRKVAGDRSMVFLLGARMPVQAFAGVSAPAVVPSILYRPLFHSDHGTRDSGQSLWCSLYTDIGSLLVLLFSSAQYTS